MRKLALVLVYLLALFTLIRAYTGENLPASGAYPGAATENYLR